MGRERGGEPGRGGSARARSLRRRPFSCALISLSTESDPDARLLSSSVVLGPAARPLRWKRRASSAGLPGKSLLQARSRFFPPVLVPSFKFIL